MTGSGANNRDVKKINRIRTIRSIFSCDRISQPELAAKVNNSWPTVLQNVKELMAMGLVQEVGTFESTGGRKARAFAPVRNARLAVGLEITQNHVGAVLVDLSGNLLRYERKKRLYERSDTYAEMLAGIVQGLIEKEGYPVEKILGVGISLPGILDKEGQTLVYSHALGLRNVPTEEFSRYIPFSCRFINDANAAGLAEVRDLESPRSLVYLSLSNRWSALWRRPSSCRRVRAQHARSRWPPLLLRKKGLSGCLLLCKSPLPADRRKSCTIL